MNEILDKQLCEKYPLLFKDRNAYLESRLSKSSTFYQARTRQDGGGVFFGKNFAINRSFQGKDTFPGVFPDYGIVKDEY